MLLHCRIFNKNVVYVSYLRVSRTYVLTKKITLIKQSQNRIHMKKSNARKGDCGVVKMKGGKGRRQTLLFGGWTTERGADLKVGEG